MNTEHTISQEQEIRLSILGMRCAGCIAAVETALQEVVGVKSVNVNFADHSAVVTGVAPPEQMKRALKQAGYDAAVMEGLEDPAEEEQQEADCQARAGSNDGRHFLQKSSGGDGTS